MESEEWHHQCLCFILSPVVHKGTISAYLYQKLHYVDYSDGEYLGHDVVVEYEVSVPYGSNEQIAFAVLSFLLCFILNFLPTILLILYPFRHFRALLFKCRLDGIALNTFVEKFNGCYRNGLDGGKDMRSFSGLYFAVRLILIFASAIIGDLLISKNDLFLLRNIIFTITTLLVALCRPYKKAYMNVLDTLLLAHLGIFCHLMSSYAGFQDQANFVITYEVMTALPFAGFVIFFLVQALQKVSKTHVVQMLFRKCKGLCCLSAIQNIHTCITRSSNDNQNLIVQPTLVNTSADYGSINIQYF